VVTGTVSFSSGSFSQSVNLSGSAAFSSTGSYNCQTTTYYGGSVLTDGADKVVTFVNKSSGSGFTIARKDNGVAITVSYFCVGG